MAPRPIEACTKWVQRLARTEVTPGAPTAEPWYAPTVVRRILTWGVLASTAWLAACGSDDDSDPVPGGSGGVTTSTTATGGSGASGASGASGGADAGSGGAGAMGAAGGSAPTALVHRVGRFDDTDAAGARFTWPGTSFRTRIEGTSLDVELDGSGGVFFEVIVDGSSTGPFQTTGGVRTYPVAANLSDGTHDVEIFRRNEGFAGTVQMLGFVPASGTTLVESPRPYVHRIELIGDSLTAGYGIEGADQYCDFSADTENAYLTYGAVAARAVGAEAHIIAYSGKGVFQDYGGGTSEQMPELFLRTLTHSADPAWDFASWTPEAVVVNLGTNDVNSGVASQSFITAYVGLLQAIRGYYPSAAIFCVSWASWGSSAEGWVDTAVANAAVGSTYRLSFATDPADGYGCDWHTSIASNAKLGQQLATAFATELGW